MFSWEKQFAANRKAEPRQLRLDGKFALAALDFHLQGALEYHCAPDSFSAWPRPGRMKDQTPRFFSNTYPHKGVLELVS